MSRKFSFKHLKEVEQQKRDRESLDAAPTHVPETHVPETHVPDVAEPASATSVVPETHVPETHVTETPVVAETYVPETHVTETHVREAYVTGTHVPVTQVPAGKDRGRTALDNWVWDDLIPSLASNEQLVMMRIYRLTLGFRREECVVSLDRLAEKTDLSRSTVERTVKRLAARGLISSEQVNHGPRAARGLRLRLLGPALPPETGVRGTRVTETRVRGTRVAETHVPATHMKDSERKDEKAVADAPPDIYSIRKTAARIHEAEPDLPHDELVTAVRRAYVGEGRGVTRDEIEDAIRGLAL